MENKLNETVINYKRGLLEFNTAFAYINGYVECLEDAGLINNKSELFNTYVAKLLEVEKEYK